MVRPFLALATFLLFVDCGIATAKSLLNLFRSGKADKRDLEVVLARYDEDVSWSDGFHRVLTVYCKGGPACSRGEERLENVGGEVHAFLHHIVDHYDSLARWTVFLPAAASAGERPPSSGSFGGNLSSNGSRANGRLEDYLPQKRWHLGQAGHPKEIFHMTDKVHLPSLRHASRSAPRFGRSRCPAKSSRNRTTDDLWLPYQASPQFDSELAAKCAVEGSQLGESMIHLWNKHVRLPLPPGNILHYSRGSRFAASRSRIRQRPRWFYARLLWSVNEEENPCMSHFLRLAWFYIIGAPERSACAITREDQDHNLWSDGDKGDGDMPEALVRIDGVLTDVGGLSQPSATRLGRDATSGSAGDALGADPVSLGSRGWDQPFDAVDSDEEVFDGSGRFLKGSVGETTGDVFDPDFEDDENTTDWSLTTVTTTFSTLLSSTMTITPTTSTASTTSTISTTSTEELTSTTVIATTSSITTTMTTATTSLTTSTASSISSTTDGGAKPCTFLLVSPGKEISAQRPFELQADAVGTPRCEAPRWRAWWLVRADLSSATLLSESQGNETSLSAMASPSVAAPEVGSVLGIPGFVPGKYLLRLVLSDMSGAAWEQAEDDSQGILLSFDSGSFVIDAPPANGACVVQPAEGFIVTTMFQLNSTDWIDDDLPLQHRFSWRQSSSSAWKFFTSWSAASSFTQAIFGNPGNFSIRAEARDTLGSISLALNTISVIEPEVAFSNDELLDLVANVQGSGDAEATIAAVSVVASASASMDTEFANTLLDAMNTSGAIDGASAETLSAVADAVGTIVSSGSTEPGAAPAPLDPEVAAKATELVSQAASAALELESGLEPDAASSFIGTIGTLFVSTESAATSGNSSAGSGAGGAASASAAEAEALSGVLQEATSAVADAVSVALPVGQEVAVPGPGGMTLNVAKQSSKDLMTQGFAVSDGSLTLPPLPDLALAGSGSARRLSACDTASVQRTSWPTNPFAYAGSTVNASADLLAASLNESANSTSNGSDSGTASETYSECCTVDARSVERTEIRACNQPVVVENLAEPINFTIYAPRSAPDSTWTGAGSDGMLYVKKEVRICQFWNVKTQSWSGEGCWVRAIHDDYIECSCNHLTNFAAAGGFLVSAFAEVLEGFLKTLKCSQAVLLSEEAISTMLQATWLVRWDAVFLLSLALLQCVLLFVAFRRGARWRREGLLQDKDFLLEQDDDEPEDKKPGFVQKLKETLKKQMERLKKMFKKSPEETPQKDKPRATSKIAAKILAQMTHDVSCLQLGLRQHDAKVLLEEHRSQIGGSVDSIRHKFLRRLDVSQLSSSKFVRSSSRLSQVQDGDVIEVGRVESQSQNGMARQIFSLFATVESRGTLLKLAFLYCLAKCPITTILNFSMFQPPSVTVLLFMSKSFGIMMLNALLFQTAVGALDKSSDLECQPQGIWQELGKVIAVGLISELLGKLPLSIMATLHKRDFQQVSGDKASGVLRKWRFKRILLWVIGTAYLSCCFFFVATFLANVTAFSAKEWMVAAGIALVKEHVVVPIAVAVGCFCLAMLVLWSPCSSDATRQEVIQLGTDLINGVERTAVQQIAQLTDIVPAPPSTATKSPKSSPPRMQQKERGRLSSCTSMISSFWARLRGHLFKFQGSLNGLVGATTAVKGKRQDLWKLDVSSAERRVSLTRPPDKDNELVKVAAKHGPAGILAVLRQNRDYSWFVVLTFRAIQACLGLRQETAAVWPCLRECDSVAFAMEMMELEMIDEIFQLMKYFSSVRDVHHHGLAIIELLVMDDPEWRDEVARKGGVPLLCDIAKQRKDSPSIACQAMTCMAYLAAEDHIEVMLGQHDALHCVCYTLAVHVANTELVTRASLALLNLTLCEAHVEELMEKDAILLVLAVLDKHPGDLHLVVIIMGVLANFSVKGDVRALLVREGLFSRVAFAMRLDPKNSVLQAACVKSLVNYSTNVDHFQRMEELGIPDLVGESMVQHADDPGVQRYGNYFLGEHTQCPIL